MPVVVAQAAARSPRSATATATARLQGRVMMTMACRGDRRPHASGRRACIRPGSVEQADHRETSRCR